MTTTKVFYNTLAIKKRVEQQAISAHQFLWCRGATFTKWLDHHGNLLGFFVTREIDQSKPVSIDEIIKLAREMGWEDNGGA